MQPMLVVQERLDGAGLKLGVRVSSRQIKLLPETEHLRGELQLEVTAEPRATLNVAQYEYASPAKDLKFIVVQPEGE